MSIKKLCLFLSLVLSNSVQNFFAPRGDFRTEQALACLTSNPPCSYIPRVPTHEESGARIAPAQSIQGSARRSRRSRGGIRNTLPAAAVAPALQEPKPVQVTVPRPAIAAPAQCSPIVPRPVVISHFVHPEEQNRALDLEVRRILAGHGVRVRGGYRGLTHEERMQALFGHLER